MESLSCQCQTWWCSSWGPKYLEHTIAGKCVSVPNNVYNNVLIFKWHIPILQVHLYKYEIHRQATTPPTMVTGFGLLSRPSLEHIAFWIKENPHNLLNMKWEDISFLHTDIDQTINILWSGWNKPCIIKDRVLLQAKRVSSLKDYTCMYVCMYVCGARGGVVVMALRYKPAGRGFDSRWCHWNFSVT
jgi:hypothetical protein